MGGGMRITSKEEEGVPCLDQAKISIVQKLKVQIMSSERIRLNGVSN